ncbi:MAG: hypothetical protein DRR06_16585 [Gammaproteobacteria bacterium]|nr:MAG: hypothetical protein DRR06_16585 [Gammaproteobacteria bacterium]
MLSPLDGPAKQDVVSVDNITVVEVKVDATPMVDRKVVSLQADGKFRVYFGDGTNIPNAALLLSDGIKQPKDTLRSYEAGGAQQVFVLSDTGASINVTIVERA